MPLIIPRCGETKVTISPTSSAILDVNSGSYEVNKVENHKKVMKMSIMKNGKLKQFNLGKAKNRCKNNQLFNKFQIHTL